MGRRIHCHAVSRKQLSACKTQHRQVRATGRLPKKCPLCKASIINIPRHLRESHKWNEKRSRGALQEFGLRKPKRQKDVSLLKFKDYHKKRLCPMDDRREHVIRLGPHLEKKHELLKGSCIYQKMLKKGHGISKFMKIHGSLAFERVGRKMLGCDDSSEPGNEPLTDVHNVDIEPDELIDRGLDNTFYANDTLNDPAEDNNEGNDDMVDSENSAVFQNLSRFENWLLSNDGGRKAVKSAKQHRAQIARILMSSEGHGFPKLWDQAALHHFTDVTAVEKGLSASTVKSYLGSLRHFYSYLLTDSEFVFDAETSKQIQNMDTRVTKWITSFRKEEACQRLTKHDKDIDNLILPDDVVKL
jgi:hypothetical protein